MASNRHLVGVFLFFTLLLQVLSWPLEEIYGKPGDRLRYQKDEIRQLLESQGYNPDQEEADVMFEVDSQETDVNTGKPGDKLIYQQDEIRQLLESQGYNPDQEEADVMFEVDSQETDANKVSGFEKLLDPPMSSVTTEEPLNSFSDENNEIPMEPHTSPVAENDTLGVQQGSQTDDFPSADFDVESQATDELLTVLKDSAPNLAGLSINIHVDNMNNYFPQFNKSIESQEDVETNSVEKKRKLFVLEYTKSTWVEANALCRSFGGTLASISSEEENAQAVETLQRSHEPLSQVWIGGLCPDKGKSCFWVDSWESFGFDNWMLGQPNHLNYDGADEQCVQYKMQENHWSWNDDHCFKEFPFVCQYSY